MKRRRTISAVCLAAVLSAASEAGWGSEAWRYLSEGAAPAPAWLQPGFDDASWQTGNAPFGFGSKGLSTVIPWGLNPAAKPVTTWFRRTFDAPALKPDERAVVACCVDDGAVIYLNGREIGRVNMPEGAPAPDTRAVRALSDNDEGFYRRLPVPASALLDGRNTLAVEVHQCSPASSDLFFDLSLKTAPAPAAKPEVPAAARRVVDLYLSTHRIGPEDLIPDGYLDGGRRMRIDAANRATSSREILCVDRPRDARLRKWLADARAADLLALPPLARAKRLAALIDAESTPPGDLRWIEESCGQLEKEFADKPVLLGDWLSQSRAGMCRHRALLFKVLADEAGLKSALVRGNHARDGANGRTIPHIWNELLLDDGQRVLVDVMLKRAEQTFPAVNAPAVAARYLRVDNAPWYEARAAPADMRQRAEELKNLKWGLFVCWSLSTFSGKEWTPGVADPSFFKATDCDTDQWARTAKEAGMGYILFLAKHHDGFCLWDTKTTDRKVTKAPLGRDVLAELRKSCDKHGIRLALYFSEGDWTWPGAKDGKGGGSGTDAAKEKAQLTELLTQYGPVEYLWVDHAAGTGGLSHAEFLALCKSLQPGCFVGFNHGEQAGADIRIGEMGRPGPLTDHAAAGPHMKDAPASSYLLAEFTYPILPPHKGGAMWFYSLPEHDGLCHPPEKLYRDYLGAVQYGNIFSVDVGPDYAGKLRAVDVQTLRQVGEMIRSPPPARVSAPIDWPAFLARHDLVWEVLPEKFDHGAFLGNGLLGTTIFRDGPNRLRFEIGRSDVTDHRRDNGRLPVGGMVLTAAGAITNGTLRTDLWNAEVRGEVATERGHIRFRALTHADEIALLVDLESDPGEAGAALVWEPAKAEVFRDEMKKVSGEPNPPPVIGADGDVSFCEQRRAAGGAYTTAWRVEGEPGRRRLTLTVADTFPSNAAKADATSVVRRVSALDAAALEQSHRSWWHAYYPSSFLTVPDAQIEGFYWIQMYKLACATRRDRQVIDLLGPWYRQTGWPRIWWNLNIQLAYSPVFAANRLELGESFTRFIDAKRDNFVRNAREIWGFDGCATVPHTTDYEGLRGDGTCAPQAFINPGDFTWALWLYGQQYRYSMEHALVTNRTEHAFYPLLKGSVNLYLKLLKPGEDGRLHLPPMHSPEYSQTPYADNNYNLSLLRWGCTTLLDLDARYGFKDPQRPEWERVLRDLAPYPANENGFMVGAAQPFEKSHRHWSHLLMVWPLHLISLEQPENRALVETSLKHWLTVEGGRQIYGWSSAAASCLYSCLGDGEQALAQLRAHHGNARSVMPNTMYIEGSPVIECSLVAARSLQEMLLQSWGGHIRVFPAMPAEWEETAFHDLRAEGAFLVSAARRDGKTRWVRIKSLAGEPCRVRPGFQGAFATSQPSVKMEEIEPGVFELGLCKGQEVILFQEAGDLLPEVLACAMPTKSRNAYGLKDPKKALRPALSTGKPVRASSEWSAGYSAAKANDDDPGTRWGAAPNSRSGWLELDLGSEQRIGGVEIWEIQFPRVQAFSVAVQQGGAWRDVARDTKVNGKKTLTFAPVTARHVRLTVHEASEVPTLEEFRVLAP